MLAVRRHGSLAQAAHALHVAPPVVSKRLAALEARLGLRLFQRTTRRVSPTAEGETLCDRAVGLLQAFESVESELREHHREPTGPIRLAATFGFGRRWLGPVLAAFQAHHPKVTVQLQLTEQLPDLAVEGYDAAVWLWGLPGERSAEWMARRLAPNQRVLVASPAYLARRGVPDRSGGTGHPRLPGGARKRHGPRRALRPLAPVERRAISTPTMCRCRGRCRAIRARWCGTGA